MNDQPLSMESSDAIETLRQKVAAARQQRRAEIWRATNLLVAAPKTQATHVMQPSGSIRRTNKPAGRSKKERRALRELARRNS